LNLPKRMFEPVAYSPITQISVAISASDTTITIDDGALLGDAPNIAVIGALANIAETIIYGGKSGNILSNVQRGVQGIAKSWDAGDPITRNFTALDQSNIQNNINALNSGKVSLTGDVMTGSIYSPSFINSQSAGGSHGVKNDTRLMLYDNGGENWAGIGVNSGGHIWLRIGVNNATQQVYLFTDNVAVFEGLNLVNVSKVFWHNGNLPIETGSWSGSPAFPAYQVHTEVAQYQRIGNRVFLDGYFVVTKDSNTSYDSNVVSISGLPYPGSPYQSFSGLHMSYSSEPNLRGGLIAYDNRINLTGDKVYFTVGQLPGPGMEVAFIISGTYLI